MNVPRRNSSAATLGLLLIASLTFLPAVGQAPPTGTSPHAISLYNLGLTSYKQGSPESAIIFFKRACDIDPSFADAQYNLGVLYQSQRRLKEAVPRFQEVLRVKPDDPEAHYQLALCFCDLGQPGEARAHLAAIPPSNAHFPDSQKRLQSIDSGAAIPSNQTAAPPMQPPASSYQPPQTLTPTAPETSYAPPATAVQPQQPTYSAPPQQPMQQSYAQPQIQAPPAVQQIPPVQPSQRTYQNSPNGPVPILANTTCRVIATGFSAPAGLAFDRSGNLYVANFNSNTVDRINADGSRSQFSSGSNLKGPIGLAVDSSSNVYVANYKGGTIARISPAGISTIIANGFKEPYYLTLDKEGNLFVSQQEDNSIVRISLPRPAGMRPQ